MRAISRKIFWVLSFWVVMTMASCGSKGSTTIINVGGEDNGGSGESDEEQEIAVESPSSVGSPVIRTGGEHVELLLTGGDVVPLSKNVSETGSIDMTTPLSF